MIRVALFSEDMTLYSLLASALGRDFSIAQCADRQRVARLAENGEADVLVLDLYGSGFAYEQRMNAARQLIDTPAPAIVMADDSLRLTAFELVQNGAFAYCRRPPSIRDLKVMLTRAFESTILKQEAIAPKPVVKKPEADRCDRIIGSSPKMKRVYQHVRSVSNINAAVLVTGQSGTGKELIARAIHNTGSRAGKPFVAVSCGAIPETLIESELFGHEKGAFTGSTGAHEGYFEQAQDGTLFLDEIGDLSLFTQVKLLRVLQQMEFCRLGSTKVISLRARIVFATHQDLGKLVQEGKFRQDLYYRINVMRIEAPRLQERAEDVPAIAEHFLRHYSNLFEKPVVSIEPEAMDILMSYSWPGNVRELENVMQRAIILAPETSVRAEDLSIAAQDEEEMENDADVLEFSDYSPTGTFERKLRDYKVKLAATAVREANGNKTVAARSLSISRAYLHRLLRLAEPEMIYDEPVLREAVNR